MIFFTTLVSCTNFSFQEAEQKEISRDSTIYWIKQSKIEKRSLFQKKNYLSRAYQEERQTNHKNKSKYLSKIAYQYLILEDTVLFKNINKEAYQIAKKQKDTIILGDIHWNYAYHYNQKVKYDSAYYHSTC